MNVLLIGYGYIGVFLHKHLKECGYKVTIVEHDFVKFNKDFAGHWIMSYQNLTSEFLKDFDVILWFAGHSSVQNSSKDPSGAMRNNCFDLVELLEKKQDKTLFIYASSASVYSQTHGASATIAECDEHQATVNPLSIYDSTKIAFDALAAVTQKNVIGLRLGTLCGYSDHLRPELIFNSMNISALKKSKVMVANEHAYRTILFLDDLALYVEKIIATRNSDSRIFNVGSLTFRIGEIAEQIASHHGVKIDRVSGLTETYSFKMNCDLIAETICKPNQADLKMRCEQFTKQFLTTK